MELLKLQETDVILQEFGEKEGKIIISNLGYGSFSYQWGAMKSTLKEFLCGMNESYFVDKLAPTRQGKLDIKKTMSVFRREIRDVLQLPYWKEMEFQKELRFELNRIEKTGCEDSHTLMSELDSLLSYRLDFYLIKNKQDKDEIESGLKSIFQDEVWHSFVYGEPREYDFLRKTLKELKTTLQKNKLSPQPS